MTWATIYLSLIDLLSQMRSHYSKHLVVVVTIKKRASVNIYYSRFDHGIRCQTDINVHVANHLSSPWRLAFSHLPFNIQHIVHVRLQ